MKTFTATEMKQRSGEIIDTCLQEPVSILKHGRELAVLTSDKEYREYLKAKQLRSEVQKGFDQIDEGNFSTRSMDDLAAEAVRRVEAKRAP